MLPCLYRMTWYLFHSSWVWLASEGILQAPVLVRGLPVESTPRGCPHLGKNRVNGKITVWSDMPTRGQQQSIDESPASGLRKSSCPDVRPNPGYWLLWLHLIGEGRAGLRNISGTSDRHSSLSARTKTLFRLWGGIGNFCFTTALRKCISALCGVDEKFYFLDAAPRRPVRTPPA